LKPAKGVARELIGLDQAGERAARLPHPVVIATCGNLHVEVEKPVAKARIEARARGERLPEFVAPEVEDIGDLIAIWAVAKQVRQVAGLLLVHGHRPLNARPAGQLRRAAACAASVLPRS